MKQLRRPWLLLLFACSACTQQPSEPDFDSPLDPRGPDGGDPFELTVQFEGPGMRLQWNDISAKYPDLTGYRIYASTNPLPQESDFRSSTGIGDGTTLRLLDPSYTRDAVNYYKVVAERGSEISSLEAVLAAQAYAPPSARLSNGRVESPQPDVRLSLLPALSNGDLFELSTTDDFAAPTSFASTAAPVDFDLGPVGTSGTNVLLYSRLRYGGAATTSPVGVDTIVARLSIVMDPLVFGDLTDTTVVIDVRLLDGVTRMRFANSQGGLATGAWSVPDSNVLALVQNLDAASLTHTVWGEFESSFGFLEEHSTPEMAAVDSVGAAFFTLASAQPTVSTTEVQVTGIVSPGAGYMRFSEDIAFTGVAWQKFAGQTTFQLSATPGEKTVYGQFSNPFVPSDIESALDTILLLGTP